MHELSLAQSLISQLLDLVKEHQAKRVTRVSVTIGPFSGIVRDSFEFGFNAVKLSHQGTRETILELHAPDPLYLCLDCRKVSSIPFSSPSEQVDPIVGGIYPKKCPWCCQPRLSPKGGIELILNQLEME